MASRENGQYSSVFIKRFTTTALTNVSQYSMDEDSLAEFRNCLYRPSKLYQVKTDDLNTSLIYDAVIITGAGPTFERLVVRLPIERPRDVTVTKSVSPKTAPQSDRPRSLGCICRHLEVVDPSTGRPAAILGWVLHGGITPAVPVRIRGSGETETGQTKLSRR